MWTAISIIVAFIACIFTYAQWLQQRRVKKLAYSVTSITPIVNEHKGVAKRIHITFDNNPIQNAKLVQIVFRNTGNVPITSSDYAEPITIDFGNAANVLTADGSAQVETELNALAAIASPIVTLTPLLLNPKDRFSVVILVTGEKIQPTVHCHIAGITKLSTFNEDEPAVNDRRSRSDLARVFLTIAALFICILTIIQPNAINGIGNDISKPFAPKSGTPPLKNATLLTSWGYKTLGVGNPELVVRNYSQKLLQPNELDIIGTIENNTNQPLSYVEVQVETFDKQNIRLNNASSSLSGLAPGESWKFHIQPTGDGIASSKILIVKASNQ